MKTIIVVIQRDGRTKVETQGFTGPACREASRFLERSLGRTATETLTAAFHEAAQSQTTTAQRTSQD
jgi:hypothetical protein